MTPTTMHFGPEWMRTKQPTSARPHAASSPPPPSGGFNTPSNGSHAPPGASSYSALVTPPAPPVQLKRDVAHPFRYSRDEMLQIWSNGGGRGPLPIEVERWEGVVREAAGEPVCLCELSEAEKKLYASSSLNSEPRRRQSVDYLAQGSKLGTGGPMNNGIGLMGRRRRGDSSGAERIIYMLKYDLLDQPPLTLPRKTSWSGAPGTLAGNLAAPSLTSPRTRLGGSNGFDGVLNGNDNAWNGGKRRVSGQPNASRVDEEVEGRRDIKAEEIKEEETQDPTINVADGEHASPSVLAPSAGFSAHPAPDVKKLQAAVDNLTLDTNLANLQGNRPLDVGENSLGSGQPDTSDLAKVLWSYVDPSGNVQGPFPGETMQTWHEQHYFTDNLMMKRVTIDTEFMPLADIKRRAQGERVFLSPINDVLPPPGLVRIPAAGPTLLHRLGVVDSSRQPSPQTYGRNNNVDAYINANSTASASPSSSFGGNFTRPPISPDPIAVGSRLPNQRFANEMPLNGRTSANGYSSNSSPAMPQAVRHVYNDGIQSSRSSSFDAQGTNLPNMPWQTLQNNGIQGWNGPPEVSQLGQLGRLDTPNSHSPFMREPSYIAPVGPPSADPFTPSSGPPHRFFEQSEQSELLGQIIAQRDDPNLPFSNFPNNSPSRFVGAPQQLSLPPLSTGFAHDFDQPSPVAPSPTAGRIQTQFQPRQTPPVSPWGVPQVQEPQRPRPFDADRPTASNTFLVNPSAPPQRPAWAKPQVEAQLQANGKDPWTSNPPRNTNEGWGQRTEDSQSLTTANVIQHNVHHGSVGSRELNEPLPSSVSAAPAQTAAETAPVTSAAASPALATPINAATGADQQAASKRKGKTAAQTSAPEQNQAAATAPPLKALVASPSSQKAAWITDEDVKAKRTTASTSLREIQEAENKLREAQKAAAMERERAARAAAAASSSDEVQFTASWGLPTSQTGGRSNVSPGKDVSATSPASSSAPVWTNSAKPAAKTMKEIQEEEERRKMLVKEKETIASAAKRAVQVPAAKGPLAPQAGGAWTVVGSGGKPPVPASIAPARPAPITQASAPNTTPSRPAAVVSSPRPASSPQAAKAAPAVSKAVPKAQEEPGAPSPEFLKWMRDSLKGLNSSVQFEEIAQMLLFFPLDPDPSTVELIAETVYGASTTLDGRRFAAEFIAKRKADAASRPRAAQSHTAANGKASLADVVKAQPKQAQNEFGGYKVVKKKNKGGRA
ncbi:hypothetical protein DFH11DRAFT_1757206 [Phellopilus nigrolimitatus]|nr:hypothetical protein DFH11DRAFT_1757206 [Phellopilus nigrolimitatus]